MEYGASYSLHPKLSKTNLVVPVLPKFLSVSFGLIVGLPEEWN
jgi:hypothetical protein